MKENYARKKSLITKLNKTKRNLNFMNFHDINDLSFSPMNSLQITHLSILSEQLMQQAKWPHGTNTMQASFRRHFLHFRDASSLFTSCCAGAKFGSCEDSGKYVAAVEEGASSASVDPSKSGIDKIASTKS